LFSCQCVEKKRAGSSPLYYTGCALRVGQIGRPIGILRVRPSTRFRVFFSISEESTRGMRVSCGSNRAINWYSARTSQRISRFLFNFWGSYSTGAGYTCVKFGEPWYIIRSIYALRMFFLNLMSITAFYGSHCLISTVEDGLCRWYCRCYGTWTILYEINAINLISFHTWTFAAIFLRPVYGLHNGRPTPMST